MHKGADWIPATAFFEVFALWIAFAMMFTFRKKPPKAAEAKRDPKSYWGIGLVGIGYWLVWIFPRRYFSPIVLMSRTAEIGVAALAIAISVEIE